MLLFVKILTHYQTDLKHPVRMQLHQELMFYIYLWLHKVLLSKTEGIRSYMGLQKSI